ncbi:MAG: MEDS domain-containing protein [Candidatus Eremiobacteraeota bacterium]|nr:MEDS domain-containing protein [Candidatus Eremiobacteraeota bacterium]
MATTGSPAPDRLLGDPHAGHLVQLYGKDLTPLVRSVGRYLADGLSAGEGAVVIATQSHRDAFVAELGAIGADSAAALRQGRLVVLDTHETMARFIVDGQPDRELFEATARPVLSALRARCPAGVRAYGEMVGVLWEEGRFAAAIRLEEFWNALLCDGGFRLFCAYPIDVCGDGFTPADVDAVMSTHTHVVPTGTELELALERALEDVLGTSASALRRLMDANFRPSWAALPRAEATILWLRDNVPALTGAILTRTREYAHLA